MDIIAEEGAALAVEENMFSRPESQRVHPIRDTDQIEAFQAMVHALDEWPLNEQITGWDVRMLAMRGRYDAQTRYLNHLANF